MSESVYKEKREVDEQNTTLLTEKEKLEVEKKKVDEKIKKLWSQSIAVHKEMEHINELKIEVEHKHQEVMDSVHYAKRIQNAMLKEQEHVSPHLPRHFVLFKPKDIVSGDFYWALEKQNYWYVAAADCTGHGVPGAFLTMLGTSFLNEITSTPALLSPSEILNLLRARIIKELGQTGKSGESKDGMDISLIMLNLDTKEIQWAGANNSIYLISNGELTETKADKQPIGWADNLKPFTNHTFQLKKNDAIYIFSDGFADQFGGPDGRKFMSKHMKETFVGISHLGMHAQKEKLNETFETWKGELQQIDDVCVICVKI
jgi:serine phosphatase RsbU (regulator of sigma subunit)